MNTVGAEGYSVRVYTYIRLYAYRMLYYANTVYIIWRMRKRKKRLCQDHKINILITNCAL
jgi:predicted metallopeptidase